MPSPRRHPARAARVRTPHEHLPRAPGWRRSGRQRRRLGAAEVRGGIGAEQLLEVAGQPLDALAHFRALTLPGGGAVTPGLLKLLELALEAAVLLAEAAHLAHHPRETRP